MQRYISLLVNIEGSDLGRVAAAVDEAMRRAGSASSSRWD
jgi:hypothetical protein